MQAVKNDPTVSFPPEVPSFRPPKCVTAGSVVWSAAT